MDYQFYTDNDLIKAIINDDEAAFKEIYSRYWKSLYFIALKKIRSKEVAEELVQNVLTGFWNKRNKLAIIHPENYFYSAIKYQVLNYIDSKIIRENHTRKAFTDSVNESNNCDSGALTNELVIAIDQSIKKLPDKTQTILRLSRFENYSTREISKAMNISEKGVEYHITKSLKLMRLYLRDFLMTSIPWIMLS